MKYWILTIFFFSLVVQNESLRLARLTRKIKNEVNNVVDDIKDEIDDTASDISTFTTNTFDDAKSKATSLVSAVTAAKAITSTFKKEIETAAQTLKKKFASSCLSGTKNCTICEKIGLDSISLSTTSKLIIY
jgi:hypothetical protein